MRFPYVPNSFQAGLIQPFFTIVDVEITDLDNIRSIQAIPSDGAITIREGTVILLKTGQASITGFAPIAGPKPDGEDGHLLRVVSSTAFAHIVNFPANSIQTVNGLKKTITMVPGGAALSFDLIASGGIWYLRTLTGGSVT